MSHGEELFALDTSTRPSFELALRGYDKRQVDQYASQMDSEMSTLAAERDRAYSQNRELAGQLAQLQSELATLRQRPPQIERASFRDLGPTVDQILALAEKQANEIADGAAQRAADLQAEAEKVFAEARQRADWLRTDSEAAHERATQEANRINELAAQQIEDARAEAEALVEAARAQAQQEIEAAREQTQQEVQARTETLTQLQAELDTAQQQLGQSRQEGATLEREVAQLQDRLGEVNQDLVAELNRLDKARRAAESAERHAKDVRARVQREAERVAQMAAAAVIAAAARGDLTGEYPMVAPIRPDVDAIVNKATQSPADEVEPDPGTATSHNGHARRDTDTDPAIPPQRAPHPGEVPAHPE